MALTEQQKEIAIKLLQDFLKNPEVTNQGEKENFKEFDKKRTKVLLEVSKLLDSFLKDKIPLEEFKTKIDSLNKQNPYWGFRGINGQMFFNMVTKSAKNKSRLSDILKKVITAPANVTDARKKITLFLDFLKSYMQIEDKRKAPRVKSSLYFLSYFWQIQKPEEYPIIYNSSEQVLLELNFLEYTEDLAKYYEDFFIINKELLTLFSKTEKSANLWFVEHILWNFFMQKQEIEDSPIKKEIKREVGDKIEYGYEFIPPVVAELTKLSLNDAGPKEFEKKAGILFKMFGFDVEPLGQGKGRTVDVICKANLEKPYIILVDCKGRSKKDFRFNAGDERTAIEYIKSFRRLYPEYKQTELHYLIISSGFKNDDNEVRRRIKAETNVEVSYVGVEELLFLLTTKLQNYNLDLDLMREIFSRDGIITKESVQEVFAR